MELTRTWLDDDPADRANVRVCAEIAYDDGGSPPEVYWIALPRQHEHEIALTGNPWVVALLPLAATLHEPLRVSAAVDPLLLANLRRVLRTWRGWYPSLGDIPIEVATIADPAPRTESRTVALFSGGIDSFFTLLRDRSRLGEPPIDDLLTIWGFDVPLDHPDAFVRMRVTLQRAADECGKHLVAAATNLRQMRWGSVDWGGLAHACGLVAVALVLERRWSRVLIASSYDLAQLHPWGSHPDTDPLLSTSMTAVVHDGVKFNRVEKTRRVAQSPIALRSLRVCWRSRSDTNCGACEKCYRTMTALWLLGALDRCDTFPAGSFDPARIDRIFCRSDGAAAFMTEIRDLAVSTGRTDVRRSIDRALARSRRLRRAYTVLTQVETSIRDRRWMRPATWLLQRVEWRLFRHSLR